MLSDTLLGVRPSGIEYSRGAGQYRDRITKQFVPRSRVLLEVDRESARTATRLQGLTRLLIAERITLPEWQIRFAEELKSAHLRQTMLGAGGRSQLTPQHYGKVGWQLRQEYRYLDRFAKAIQDGKITPSAALRRSAWYAESTALSFHRAEQVTKGRDGFEGKRSLDAGADHCPSCPQYVTDGFVAASTIVPVGTNCECGRKCRCMVVWRRRRQSGSQ